MKEFRNFVLRLSITYIVIYLITLLPGISIQNEFHLFAVWIVALVFTVLSRLLRPLILALTLPFTIMSGGLFMFVIDGFLLMLTDSLTTLEIRRFGWAVLAGVVMSIMNIWIESAFIRLGWLERDADDDPIPIENPGCGLRIVLMLVLLFGLLFSLSMAGQVFLAMSLLTRHLTPMFAAAGVALVILTTSVAWLVAEGLELQRRTLFSIVISTLTTALTVFWVIVAISQPISPTSPDPQPRASTQRWTLATGSEIAYTHIPAEGQPQLTPVVFLHAGPGLAVLDADIAFYGSLAELGYDVYLYDRVGTGLSGRLENIGEYTIDRHVADLEAIREEIDAVEMVLIGHEFGAELAARYMSQYPDRVAKAVFISPTPLWNDGAYGIDSTSAFGPLEELLLREPRTLLASTLVILRPQAAQALVSQEQMSDWMDLSYDLGQMVCPGDAADKPQGTTGYNLYDHILTTISAQEGVDPRPRLANNRTPTIILYAECDYVPWDVITQYRSTLPNTTVYYFADAGSMIYASRPDDVKAVIDAFLTDSRSPLSPYTSSVDPRPRLPLTTGR